MSELFIGLMSGTSVDAIDAALVDFSQGGIVLRATHEHPFPDGLQPRLQTAIADGHCGLAELAELDALLGEAFASAALALLEGAGVEPGRVRAIGSHGQTVHHQPGSRLRNSLQLGDPNRIAERTGIATVADFRRRDMAAGGEGAPLVPAFHQAVFGGDGSRVVLNLGGIANVTILPAGDEPVRGWDTGPGNTLMDAWIHRHLGEMMDRDGRWAAAHRPDPQLLAALLADPFFAAPPPKSTGREHFNLSWLERHLRGRSLEAGQVQSTLAELTATTVATAIRQHAGHTVEILVCGGGVHNHHLLDRLRQQLSAARLHSTAEAGLAPDWVEAAAFAWLARQTVSALPGNLPSVTGAVRPVVLGAIYPGA